MIHSLSLLFISQQSEIFITESSKLQTDLQISSLSPNPTETTEISDESLLKRPHHQKWHGNNPEFDAFFSNQNPDDGYILYKSLYGNHSSASPTKSQVGLYSSVTDDIESLLRPVSRVNSPIYFGKNHYDAMTIHSYSKSEVGTLNRSSQIEFKSNIETPFRSPQPIQKRSDRKALMIDIASIVSDESPQLHSPQHVRLESNEVTVHLSNLFNVSYTLSTSAFDVGRILFRSQLKNESLSLKPKVQKKKRIIKLNFKISGSVVSETNSSGILS